MLMLAGRGHGMSPTNKLPSGTPENHVVGLFDGVDYVISFLRRLRGVCLVAQTE